MDSQKKRIMEMVAKHVSELSEHVDSCRIFVTARSEKDSDHWIAYSEGRGNVYAHIGQVDEWLERQRERTRLDEQSGDFDDNEPLTGEGNEECGSE